MAQVATSSSLYKELLGDDVTEENFPERMAAFMRKKKQAIVERIAKEKRERPVTQA